MIENEQEILATTEEEASTMLHFLMGRFEQEIKISGHIDKTAYIEGVSHAFLFATRNR